MTDITEQAQQQANVLSTPTSDGSTNNAPLAGPVLSPRDVENQKDKARQKPSDAAKKESGRINSKRLNESYKKTLGIVQKELSPTQRAISMFMHFPIIEPLGGLIGRTIARPNSILMGGFFAFILTLFAYLLSTLMDYKLSGSETILAFFVGWLIGTIYDYVKLLATGKD